MPSFGTDPKVKSLAETGEVKIHGDVTLSEGANITLTQVGQNIEIAGSTGSGIDHSLLSNLNWAAAGHTIDTDVDFDGNSIDNVDAINFIGDGLYDGSIYFPSGQSIIVDPYQILFSDFDSAGFVNTTATFITLDPSVLSSQYLLGGFLGWFGSVITATNTHCALFQANIGAIPALGYAGCTWYEATSWGLTNASSYIYGSRSILSGHSSDVATARGYGFLAEFDKATTDNITSVAYGIDGSSAASIFKWAMASLKTPIYIQSGVADGAAAIPFKLDTLNTMSTAGALILSVQNNTSEKFHIDKDGVARFYGNLYDGTNSVSVANLKTAYDHSQSDHYSPQLAYGGF